MSSVVNEEAAGTTSPIILIVMGVSGSGKTTVAAMLAGRLHWRFQEGDALHPTTSLLSGAGPERRLKTTLSGRRRDSLGAAKVAPTPARTRPTPFERGQTSSAIWGATPLEANAASTRS